MNAPVFRKLGPGTLKFGPVASATEFAVACKKIEITPTTKDEDATILLDNSTYKPEGDVSGEVTGTLLQDYDTGSLIAWTWENNGAVMDFEFKPSTAGKMLVKGKCQIFASKIGGDVGKVNDSDFTFPLVGSALPTLTMV